MMGINHNILAKCFLLLTTAVLLITCSKDDDGEGFNVFTIQQDKELGQELVNYIESDTSDFLVLEPSDYPKAYEHILRIRDKILNSGVVKYKDEFEWRVRIIHDDETLNAFCAPGGYIYIYTGIIKFLDNEYELAGVMGHEIAHADKRHSTQQMTEQYGLSLLLSAIGGDESAIGNLAANLVLLKYGRDDESQADDFSVYYLCPTTYKADGAAQFFRKIGNSSVPEFLSTHPSPDNRVANIENLAIDEGCTGTDTLGKYRDLIQSLP